MRGHQLRQALGQLRGQLLEQPLGQLLGQMLGQLLGGLLGQLLGRQFQLHCPSEEEAAQQPSVSAAKH